MPSRSFCRSTERSKPARSTLTAISIQAAPTRAMPEKIQVTTAAAVTTPGRRGGPSSTSAGSSGGGAGTPYGSIPKFSGGRGVRGVGGWSVIGSLDSVTGSGRTAASNQAPTAGRVSSTAVATPATVTSSSTGAAIDHHQGEQRGQRRRPDERVAGPVAAQHHEHRHRGGSQTPQSEDEGQTERVGPDLVGGEAALGEAVVGGVDLVDEGRVGGEADQAPAPSRPPPGRRTTQVITQAWTTSRGRAVTNGSAARCCAPVQGGVRTGAVGPAGRAGWPPAGLTGRCRADPRPGCRSPGTPTARGRRRARRRRRVVES